MIVATKREILKSNNVINDNKENIDPTEQHVMVVYLTQTSESTVYFVENNWYLAAFFLDGQYIKRINLADSELTQFHDHMVHKIAVSRRFETTDKPVSHCLVIESVL